MPAMSTATEPKIKAQILPRPRLCTYDELCAQMETTNQPHELWDGELIMAPSPFFQHQDIVFRFASALQDWVKRGSLGKVVISPLDMVLTPHRMVQPDVAFIATENLGILRDVIRGPADLVAEIVSPGSRRRDRVDKKDLYEQHGVKEYWTVDPEARSVDVWHLGAGRQYELAGRFLENEEAQSRLLEGFKLNVRFLLDGE